MVLSGVALRHSRLWKEPWLIEYRKHDAFETKFKKKGTRTDRYPVPKKIESDNIPGQLEEKIG